MCVREELEDAQRGLPPPPHEKHAQEQSHAALNEPAPVSEDSVSLVLTGQHRGACWLGMGTCRRSGGVDWEGRADTRARTQRSPDHRGGGGGCRGDRTSSGQGRGRSRDADPR